MGCCLAMGELGRVVEPQFPLLIMGIIRAAGLSRRLKETAPVTLQVGAWQESVCSDRWFGCFRHQGGLCWSVTLGCSHMGVAADWAPGQPVVTLPMVWLVHALAEHTGRWS